MEGLYILFTEMSTYMNKYSTLCEGFTAWAGFKEFLIYILTHYQVFPLAQYRKYGIIFVYKEKGSKRNMDWLMDLLTNRFLITGVSSWFVAQVVKTIIHAIINKKLVLERMVGDGGMPSAHSATVTSLAVISALSFGFGSFEFAVTALLAIIVCHDAMGVRLETGKQAVIINELTKAFEELTKEDLPAVKLKEFVGHTPIQVLAGIAVGIANACFMHYVVFPLF